MRVVDTDPDEFIATFGDESIRTGMETLDEVIVDALPGRSRVLWEGVFWGGTDQQIIGYGHIRQPRPRGDDADWFLVGLARQKRNFSIYLNAVENGAYLAHRYLPELGKVRLGAASIAIGRLEGIDLPTLSELLHHANEITPADAQT